MADRPWKREERDVARLVGGARFSANSGGRVDVEGPTVVAQGQARPAPQSRPTGGAGSRDRSLRRGAGQDRPGGAQAAGGSMRARREGC